MHNTLARDRALDLANHVRTHKAGLLADMRAGRITVEAVLRDPPYYLQAIRLFELLEAAPHVGRVKTRRLNMIGARQFPPINLLAPIGELSERQREWVVERLPALQSGRAIAA